MKEISLLNLIKTKRIAYMMKVLSRTYERVELRVENIATVEKCSVGTIIPLNPTGIKIGLKNGRYYKFSSMRREKIIDTITDTITLRCLMILLFLLSDFMFFSMFFKNAADFSAAPFVIDYCLLRYIQPRCSLRAGRS